MPFIASFNNKFGAVGLGGAVAPPAPTFSLSSRTSSTLTWIITNYDAGALYSFSGTGSFSRTGNTVVQSGLSPTTQYSISGTATKAGITGAAGTSSLESTGATTPTLSVSSRNYTTIVYSITNYDASYSYSVSSTAGSVSRTTSTITVSGLTRGTTITITVTATRNGMSASANSTNITNDYPTGGTVTTSGSYRIHTFNSAGMFDASNALITSVEVLLVGGGNGGQPSVTLPGNGGNGGKLVSNASLSISQQQYAITVGGGGNAGASGSNSSIGSIIDSSAGSIAGIGGSGSPSAGGTGTANSISGASVTYGGGGGGGGPNPSGPSGGPGGLSFGGAGGPGSGGFATPRNFRPPIANNGTPGSPIGGGGGGAGYGAGGTVFTPVTASGGNGGPGTVIIRYLV